MKNIFIIFVLLTSFFIVSCGGGGGDPPPTSTTTVNTPKPTGQPFIWNQSKWNSGDHWGE